METDFITTFINKIENVDNKLNDLNNRQNFLDKILDRLLSTNKKDNDYLEVNGSNNKVRTT